MVLTKRLKKLLIIALIVVTVVWVIALYLHIQAYNRYIQDTIEGCIALGFDEYFCREGDFHPVWSIGFGGYLVLS
ncbi:MAG: hypothetical protein NWE77_04780, partial [Candidatus Bathyarchaeota archaeon]|nr:hypothetical protein [Candidatus Bathyarchaeota archaeon]